MNFKLQTLNWSQKAWLQRLLDRDGDSDDKDDDDCDDELEWIVRRRRLPRLPLLLIPTLLLLLVLPSKLQILLHGRRYRIQKHKNIDTSKNIQRYCPPNAKLFCMGVACCSNTANYSNKKVKKGQHCERGIGSWPQTTPIKPHTHLVLLRIVRGSTFEQRIYGTRPPFKGAGAFHSAGQSKEGSVGFGTSQHPIFMKLLPDHLWH